MAKYYSKKCMKYDIDYDSINQCIEESEFYMLYKIDKELTSVV